MVNRSVVLETVKKMLSQGIDESTIESTLQDIGLADEEIAGIIAESKGASTAIPPKPAGPLVEEKNEGEPEPEPAEEEAELHRENPLIDQGLVNSSVHVAVETQGKRIEDLHRNVSQLHEKLDSYSQASAEQISSRLNSIEKKLDELNANVSDSRALNSALQDLMQKILEANRRILAGIDRK
ncbi:MAG: hypothetical protein WC602_02190 [archaeon]